MREGETPTLLTPNSKTYRLGTVELPRITTLLDCMSKPALVNWAAKEERAGIMGALSRLTESKEPIFPGSVMAELAKLNGMTKTTKQPLYAHQVKSSTALEAGGDAHDVIQNALCAAKGWPSRWNVARASDQARTAAAAGLRFCRERDLDPELLEETVHSLAIGAAGTLDCVAELTIDTKRINDMTELERSVMPDDQRVRCVIDWKTGAGIYPEMQLQVGFYRACMIERDPMNAGLWGGIVRMPKDGAAYEAMLWTPMELDQTIPVIRSLRTIWEWRERTKNGRH